MPDQLSIENSPLEIYETAYRLHYIDNRISEAVKYYEILIKDFPESNECGYAAVQIQKIKASGLVKELHKSSKSAHPAALLAIILSIISILFATSASYYFYSRYKTEQHRVKLVLSALSKVYIGDIDEALKVLTELKITNKNDILPFELSSDLHQKQGHYDQARSEYEIFFRLNPSLKPTQLQLSKMQLQNKRSTVAKRTVQTEKRNSEVESIQESRTLPPQKTIPKNKTNKDQVSSPKQKIKSLFLVDPDSISYF